MGRRSRRLAQEARPAVTLVDTTVWIDFFRGRQTPEVAELERSLGESEDICICGVILTEILQGIREEDDYRRILSRFDSFLYLPMSRRTFLRAAELYRCLRRKGVTVRKPVDCMIAAVSIEREIPLLHHDRDFDPIEAYCGLKVVKTAGRTPKPQRRK